MLQRGFRRLIRSGLKRLPFPILYEAFYQAGRVLGVKSYEVSGQYGDFFGPLYDQTVIKHYLEAGTWSPDIVQLLRDFFDHCGGGSFYDIGANIGLVTVPIAQDARVSCVAFEPDPHNFRLLSANVATSCRHGNVELVNAAVYREATELRFDRNEYNSGDHRLSAAGSRSVMAIRLDDRPLPPGPLALKIDTQGAEPAIFEGAAKTLAAAGLLVFEFWPWGMARMGLSPDLVLSRLVEMFSVARILRDDGPGVWQNVETIRYELAALVLDGSEHTVVDVVATKKEAIWALTT